MEKIRTLIADDYAIFRKMVIQYLSAASDIEVVGETADGQEAIHMAIKLKPDLVLMDLSMPGMNGIEATKKLKEIMPTLKVIIVSSYDVAVYKEAAMDNGPNKYITKRSLVEELIPAIRDTFGLTDK